MRSSTQYSAFQTGDLWYADCAVLPVTKGNKYHALLVLCEAQTSYIWAAPLKKISTEETCSAMKQFLNSYGLIRFLQSDAGPEFSEKFSNFLAQYKIVHLGAQSAHSDAQAHAERGIRSLKEALLGAITMHPTYDRKCWTEVLPIALDRINQSRLRGARLSRKALFFNPWRNCFSGWNFNLSDEQMVHLHQNELDKIRDIRQTVMSNLYRKSRGKKEFYIGQVVMLRSDKSQLTTEDNSRALLSCESPYKIISLHSGDQSCRILSLINGDQRSVHISRLRALEINDIVGFQIKAKFLFENIKNMRLTNRYKRMNTGLQLNIRDSDVIQQKGDEQLQDEGKLQTGQNGQLQDKEQLQSDQSDQRQTINIDTIIQHENSQGAASLKSILKKPCGEM